MTPARSDPASNGAQGAALPDRAVLLARAAARDAAWDGVFLTCVRTTRIYCLPSCRARTPRPENVEHAQSPAEARQRGFRPCKRCRPDDFHRGFDRDVDALLAALAEARARPGDFADVTALAAAAGCGQTKLLTLCRRHLHRPPRDLLLEARLQHARAALQTTPRRVLDVALDAGFDSSSTFHARFRARFGTTPQQCRALLTAREFAVALPRPHATAAALGWQVRSAGSLAERGSDRELCKALLLAGRPCALTLRRRADRVHVEVARADGRAPGAAVMAAALEATARMLRLDCDPAPAVRAFAAHPALRRLAHRAPGLRPWATATPFEALLFAIVGQQVHLGFALQLRDAVIGRAGAPVGELWAHPDAAAVAALDERDLRAAKFSAGKAAAVGAAAAACCGELDLDALARGSAPAATAALERLRGTGPWTAQYVAMRGLGFLDCLPAGDVVLQQMAAEVFGLDARPDAAALRSLAAPFLPHRSLFAFHLWRRARAATTTDANQDANDDADHDDAPDHRPRPVRRAVRPAAGRGR